MVLRSLHLSRKGGVQRRLVFLIHSFSNYHHHIVITTTISVTEHIYRNEINHYIFKMQVKIFCVICTAANDNP
jgi:hypothetical protein